MGSLTPHALLFSTKCLEKPIYEFGFGVFVYTIMIP